MINGAVREIGSAVNSQDRLPAAGRTQRDGNVPSWAGRALPFGARRVVVPATMHPSSQCEEGA